MPSWRKKPANREYLNKRYTPRQQQVRLDNARAATRRLYCDVLTMWRSCADKRCRRHRRCSGDVGACFAKIRSEQMDAAVRAAVVTGGPRRLPPATHTEWAIRRWPPFSV
jgi:hypothetical protein